MIISVGNIAFGGRGKTPTVAAIARLLLEMGERPAIVSRGYGRRYVEDGVVVVSDGRHLLADVDRAGDEPLMLARDLPGVAVLVCEQRAIAGAFARHVLGATSIILDDGFQHRQMARDVDIVLVSPADLKGRRAPFGRLRESPSALSRADVVIEIRPDEIRGDGSRSVENSRQTSAEPALEFSTDRDPSPFCSDARYLSPLPLDPSAPPLPPGARVFALAGIAGPARFTRAIADAGYVVAGAWAPGDHHRYTRADVVRLAMLARDARADAVLTTSKDAVRLRAQRPLLVPVYEWPLRVTIRSAADPAGTPGAAFASWLRARLAAARPHAGPETSNAARARAVPA